MAHSNISYSGLAMIRYIFILCVLALSNQASAAKKPAQYGIAQAITDSDIAAWNIDVSPNGNGLPAGSGSVTNGQVVFKDKCAVCHGPDAKGGTGFVGPQLVGGQGTLNTSTPVKTIGSFWPYATTVFDYINRAMPYTKPQSLTSTEVYSLTAYLLFLNGILSETTVLDDHSLPLVLMPNRNGFVGDPRPDVKKPKR